MAKGVIMVSIDVFGKSESTHTELTVSFPYDPQLFAETKTVENRKWHLAPPHVIARRPERSEGTPKQSQFEDLRRELVSRKCSQRTIYPHYIYIA